jgi:hypothetical protein
MRHEEPGGGGLVDGQRPADVPDGKEEHGPAKDRGKGDHGRRRGGKGVAALDEQAESGQAERRLPPPRTWPAGGDRPGPGAPLRNR